MLEETNKSIGWDVKTLAVINLVDDMIKFTLRALSIIPAPKLITPPSTNQGSIAFFCYLTSFVHQFSVKPFQTYTISVDAQFQQIVMIPKYLKKIMVKLFWRSSFVGYPNPMYSYAFFTSTNFKKFYLNNGESI
jgi:hypothetical protein